MATSDDDSEFHDEDSTEPDAGSEAARRDAAGPGLQEAAKKRGRFFSLRKRGEEQPPGSKRCTVIGPTRSGKTALMLSLRRCVDARSHSYGARYVTTIGHTNEEYDRLQQWLDTYFPRGLRLDASDLGTCFVPEFTLRVRQRHRRGDAGLLHSRHKTRFRTFDGAGELLEKAKVAADPRFRECRERLNQELADCDTVLLCLPIGLRINRDQESELKNLLEGFIDSRQVRSLVVCFTMYETLGIEYGRLAYRELANRLAARRAIREALEHRLLGLDNHLEQFHLASGKRGVWCAPVSAYGFIARNGGANVAVFGKTEHCLRTTPADKDGKAAPTGAHSPYEHDVALTDWWRPFLTIDPFVFITTGDRRGTLIHAYDEIFA